MMLATALLSLAVAGQVPAPRLATSGPPSELIEARQQVVAREGQRLEALAGRLEGQNQAQAAAEVRKAIEPPPSGDGPLRVRTLPEVVPPSPVPTDPPAWAAGRDAIRGEAADELFELATRAAAPEVQRFSFADRCLRAVLDRRPDHAEARRLLGFVPHGGGWATPHAAGLLRQGYVLHPTYGWVAADWVPHLDAGELPGKVRRDEVDSWLPAEEADALRSRWDRPWVIKSFPHFLIVSDVPLAEAITFGRKLEALHDVFFSLFADVIGPDRLPLARRSRDPRRVGDSSPTPHEVWYFATREEYLDQVLPRQGPGIRESLGVYIPPEEARLRPGDHARSYFFRDPEGQLDADATLFHEASHQLLFESAGRTRYQANLGNFWVWEGLGTYFETLQPAPDGTLEIGGWVGPRLEQAALRRAEFLPLGRLVGLGRSAFNADDEVYLHYAEAQALTVFLLHGQGGRYRAGFLDYVADAYRGRLARRSHAPGLARRLGVDLDTLGEQFHAYVAEHGGG